MTSETDDLPMPPIMRIEVTVSAVIQMPDGHIFGQNMVDATLAFGWRTSEPPEGTTDVRTNAALTKALSPVLAIVSTALTFNGWIAIGEVDDPLAKAGTDTGLRALSDPVTVRVSFPDEGNAVHD